MDLERMSSNVIDIIDEILKNQKLVNYIGHNGNNPSVQSINARDIQPMATGEKLFAYPFDVEYTGDVRTELHIYYPSFEFINNSNAFKSALIFDIVVHKSIWLVSDDGKKLIRPYQITKLLVDTFKGKRVGSVGKINFLQGAHTVINSEFEGVRLIANITEF